LIIFLLATSPQIAVVAEPTFIAMRIANYPHASQDKFDMHEERPWDKQIFVRARHERQREQGLEEGPTPTPHKITRI